MDSVVKDGAVTTNVNNLDIDTKISLARADSIVASGVNIRNIENSEFVVGSNSIDITATGAVDFQITGLDFQEVNFNSEAGGSIKISKDKFEYEISRATLTRTAEDYTESVHANSVAVVTMDSTFGFKCMTITPEGTYRHSNRDARKNFDVKIPKESQVYILCLRKSNSQSFGFYDGMVDFANKKIDLSGIVQYFKQSLRNNNVFGASILAYSSFKSIQSLFFMDNEMIIVQKQQLLSKNQTQTISEAYPSNFYTIRETQIGNSLHSIVIVKLNLNKNDLNQNLINEYQLSHYPQNAIISNNVLTEEMPGRRLTILTPEHEKIRRLVK